MASERAAGDHGRDQDPGAGLPDHEAAIEHIRTVLRDLGVTNAKIAAAEADGTVDLLLVDRILLPAPARYTQRDIAAVAGMPLDVLRRFWRALGFLDVGEDEPVFTELDVQAGQLFSELLASDLTDLDAAVEVARVIGSSMARIAEAEVIPRAMLVESDDPLLAADSFAQVAQPAVPAVAQLLELVWRRHVQAATRRAMLQRAHGQVVGASPVLAVGFADMVGFTLLSQHLNESELAAVVRRFDDISHETVVGLGGRVVKMIGDEVMYVVEDPLAAVRIGIGLAEAYADDDLLSDVRVGIARGPVLVREADYFGPTVNMANRIVNVARPGTVLVSDELWQAVRQRPDAEISAKALRPRTLKGLGEVQLWSCSRPGVAEPAGETDSRYRARRWERLADIVRDLDELRERGERLFTGRAVPAGAPEPPAVGDPSEAPPAPASAGRSETEGGDPERA